MKRIVKYILLLICSIVVCTGCGKGFVTGAIVGSSFSNSRGKAVTQPVYTKDSTNIDFDTARGQGYISRVIDEGERQDYVYVEPNLLCFVDNISQTTTGTSVTLNVININTNEINTLNTDGVYLQTQDKKTYKPISTNTAEFDYNWHTPGQIRIDFDKDVKLSDSRLFYNPDTYIGYITKEGRGLMFYPIDKIHHPGHRVA